MNSETKTLEELLALMEKHQNTFCVGQETITVDQAIQGILEQYPYMTREGAITDLYWNVYSTYEEE